MIKFQLISSSLVLFTGFSGTTQQLFNIHRATTVHWPHPVKLIARKIRGTFYLKGVCLNKYMDDPLVTKMIRQTLMNYRILSESEASCVQPEHLLLTGTNQYKLKVFDGSITAWSTAVTLIVESHADITTLQAGDYFFHFIVYFTPENYLWLRNILMHDPKFSTDAWFLGCLMQVLNDNHFSSSSSYTNIPSTDSLTKIFRWSNRLEKHMDHFGAWWMTKNTTVDLMINRKHVEHDGYTIAVCKNIDVLMNNLRGFFKYQTAKNNFGAMLNLEWDYDSDNGYSLQLADIW